MPPDLAELFDQAAPGPSNAVDPERLWSVGRRRRRHRRLTVVCALVAVSGLTAVSVARVDRPEPERTVITDGLIFDEDPTRGFTVEYSATWQRAGTSLTPALTDPVEILALGTGKLPVGGHSCAQLPVAALEAMSPTDSFVTIQERGSPEAAGGFAPRPDQLPPAGSTNISEVVQCLDEPPVFDHWWFGFSDKGRAFHVLVAIGTEASDQTRSETWAILDSLRFDRR